MPLYEHVFISRPDMSSSQAESLIETYGDIVRAGGGVVGKTEYWGLRNLAYRIKRYRKGHYSLMNIDAPHEAIAEMERKMRLSSEVMRFLTISVDEHDDAPSAPMMAQSERGSRRDSRDEDGDDNDIEAASDAPEAVEDADIPDETPAEASEGEDS